MNEIKTHMFSKQMTLLMRVRFSEFVEKCHLCDYFPNPPTPIFDNFIQYETYDFARNITNILDFPAIFIFYVVFDVINVMQMLFAVRIVSFYLPRDQTLKIYVQENRQKLV